MEPNVRELETEIEKGEFLHSLEISSKTDPEVQRELARNEYAHGMTGLIIGGLCVLLGAILCLAGVVGSTSWMAKAAGLESKISDAAPGVILFIVGILIVFITRPVIKHK